MPKISGRGIAKNNSI
jgi:hypothetical protein